ncbi:hypothetical protein Trydic_g14675, partial [Trypoxylus dichotomus]
SNPYHELRELLQANSLSYTYAVISWPRRN